MASGYKFKLNSVKSKSDSTIIELVNLGIAPIYADAYLTVDGVRCSETLKLLSPDEPKTFHIGAGGPDPDISITSDDILETEQIQFFGTINEYARYGTTTTADQISHGANALFEVYPTVTQGKLNIIYTGAGSYSVSIINSAGKEVLHNSFKSNEQVDLATLPANVYFVLCKNEAGKQSSNRIVKQ